MIKKKTKLKNLFSPLKIKSMELKNRIVMAPMTTLLASEKGEITDGYIDFYTARAKGGVALITAEAVDVHPYTHNFNLGDRGFTAIYDDRFMPGLKRLTDSIHSAGAKVSIQLQHSGAAMMMVDPSQPPVAPSAIPSPGAPLPKALTVTEIKEVIRAFGKGAKRAKETGFDAVDIHGAHGYLIAQFMSAFYNRRSDGYGGDLRGRIRFPIEVLREVRKNVGDDFPIIFRLSADERAPDGRTVEESVAIAPLLVEAGADCLSITTGTNFTRLYTVPPMGSPKGLNIDATAAVRKAVDVPVIVVGRMTDPILAESVLEGGKADLVAMGRGLVADPELPNKLKENKFDDVRWCIGCNQGCMGGLIGGLPFTCLVNPAAGHEQEMELKQATVAKKVFVAGGGPAGMEAARVLALRGHKVTLYEQNDYLGGQFYLASLPPLKQEISQYLRYLKVQLEKTGVEVLLGQALTPDIVTDVSPDAVVVATGSKHFIPDIKGIDGDNVVLAHDVLTGKASAGKRVLVAGGGQVGCETAKFLERYRKQVTIVEMRPEPAFDVIKVPREALMHSLKKTQIKILTSRTIKEIIGNGVVVEHEGEKETLEGMDTIVLAMGVVSISSLADEIKDMVSEIHLIGDAGNLGNALNAIAAGVKIGRQI